MTTQVSETRYQRAPAARCPDATVLIVDDDEHFRALARNILETASFEVIEAGGFTSCLAQIRSHAVDAVILDMVMPDYDGIQTLRELKTLFPETKVVTVSGVKDGDLFLTVSAHLGADASLAKSEVASLGSMLDLILDR